MSPTNTLGARIRAQCDAKTMIYGWHHELSVDANHEAAARSLMKDLGWDQKNDIVCGGLKDGSYVFVMVEKLGSGLIRRWE